MKTQRIAHYGIYSSTVVTEFKVGDRIIWNFGYTSVVQEIFEKTPKTITFKLRSEKDGQEYLRDFRKTRTLVKI